MARRTTLRPLTDLRRRPTELIHQLQEDRVPVLITERGQSAAVLLDVETYEEMQSRLELLEGVARGERAYSEGRVSTHATAKKRLGRWLGRVSK
jgi:prevent-host-death family protein